MRTGAPLAKAPITPRGAGGDADVDAAGDDRLHGLAAALLRAVQEALTPLISSGGLPDRTATCKTTASDLRIILRPAHFPTY